MSDDLILRRSVSSTKKYRPASWSHYLDHLADTDQGIADYYKTQQKQFNSLCRQTSMPSMVIDSSGADWEDISFQIIEFMEQA